MVCRRPYGTEQEKPNETQQKQLKIPFGKTPAMTSTARTLARTEALAPRVPGPGPARRCQWIEEPGRFCGAPSVPGTSWCQAHYRRVFVRPLQLGPSAAVPVPGHLDG
jgi:hypothetical protein